MTNTKQLAGLVGPMLVALTLSENEFVQPHLYDAQIPPVVYLSGSLILLAGLSIVRVHNRWVASWPVLVTIIGWFAILGGLGRMFTARQYQHVAQQTTALFVLEIVLLAVGVFLTYKAYSLEKQSKKGRRVKA
jgi:uncharacterized membrane protein HdeD (DUF308 family)